MAGKPKKQTKHPGHYVREWREVRGYSLEKLAEMVGKTHPTISRIEHGGSLNRKMLEALAKALKVSAFDLEHRHPEDPPTIFSYWSDLSDLQRTQLTGMAEVLHRTGKAG